MDKTVPKRTLLILSIVFLIPFIIISLYAYFLIKDGERSELISTMRRFNEHAANAAIDRPIEEINLQIRSLSGCITQDLLTQYIKEGDSNLSAVIPAVVNSTFFFHTSIISDKSDNYKIYPHLSIDKFKPTQRPWYYPNGIKDEVHFSEPYTSKYPPYGKDIVVSMNLFDNASRFIGNVAFDLDLPAMSSVLKNISIPYNGRFKVVAQDGSVILNKNANEIFRQGVPAEWIDRATESRGYFYDDATQKFVFYKTYNNPNWIAFSVVDKANFEEQHAYTYQVFYFTVAGCLVFYLMMLLLLMLYFKQIVTKLYMSVKGISTEDYKDLNLLYKHIKENNQRLKTALHDAETDSLTGVGNRKELNEDLSELIQLDEEFNISIIDIDNFKSINDTYGHDFGDVVLKYVSATALKVIGNGGDYALYRFGGEEFVVIDKAANTDEFSQTLETWLNIVGLKHWEGLDLRVTFSAGIASKRSGDEPENILKRADINLYKAKTTGKNKIVKSD